MINCVPHVGSHHKGLLIDVNDVNCYHQVSMLLYYLRWHSNIIRHYCYWLSTHCLTFEIVEADTVDFIIRGYVIRHYGVVRNQRATYHVVEVPAIS